MIDGCAAPGNKTSHLAALLGNEGTVYAFDRSKERFQTLESRCMAAGATGVTPTLGDFLKSKHADRRYKHVQYALVDPSCSGSGIADRPDSSFDTGVGGADTAERLRRLSAFQSTCVVRMFATPPRICCRTRRARPERFPP